MYSVNIPGAGVVEVDSDEALRKLRAKLAANTKKPEPPVDIAKVISDSNRQLVAALTSAISRIEKPTVNIPAPVVNYTPPDIKVNVPAPIVNITQEAPEREEEDEEDDTAAGRIHNR